MLMRNLFPAIIVCAVVQSLLCPRADAFDGQSLPASYRPQNVAPQVARHFAESGHFLGRKKGKTYIVYPEVCTWLGGLRYAAYAGDSELTELLKTRFDKVLEQEPGLMPDMFHVDLNMFGSLPLELFLQTRDSIYLKTGLPYAQTQWQCPDDATDEEKEWAGKGYSWQTRLWIDDMYMITIVQTQAYRATGDAVYLTRAAEQMCLYLDTLQLEDGLFYHAPDVPFIWSRGDGWMAAGMTELLKVLPKSAPAYRRIMKGYLLMMSTLKKYQAPSGLWRQLIDREDIWEETSGSGMFAYAMISGVNNGWLDPSYEEVARKAWMALVDKLDKNWEVTDICVGTNKKNDLQYYYDRPRKTGDFHGQAPLLWCAAALMEGSSVVKGGPDFVVTRLGVRGNRPEQVQTDGIQKVIDMAGAYYRNTGGRARVVFPKGIYTSGALYVRQGVDVELEDGAVLAGSTDISDYPLTMTRIEGRNRRYFPALLNADHCPGFTLSGKGAMDGNGLSFWKHFWLRRSFNPDCTNLDEMRPRMLFVSHSDGVTVKDVTIRNSPYWHTHFYKCRNLLLDGLTITAPHTPVHAPSTDAVDIDVCSDVRITGCYMSVDDDAVSFKGGKGPWADTVPENGPNMNCIIEDCRFGYCQQIMVFGSESVRDSNIVMRNCIIEGNPQRVLRFKMRPDTPQIYEDVLVENVTGTAQAFLHIMPWTQFYDLGDRPDIARSYLHNVRMNNIEMNLSRFTDVSLKPDEYEVRDVFRDGVPVDFDASNKYLNKELRVPFIEGLETMDPESFASAMAAGATAGSVDRACWPADWPERPQCEFRIARCREGLALMFDVCENGLRAKECRDGGRIREDSCCGIFVVADQNRTIEISASGALSCSGGPGTMLSGIKRWTSLNRDRKNWNNVLDTPVEKNGSDVKWRVCLLIPFDSLGLDGSDLPSRVKANFHKRADLSSAPHCLTWNPVGTKRPDFMHPDYTGTLVFGE